MITLNDDKKCVFGTVDICPVQKAITFDLKYVDEMQALALFCRSCGFKTGV